MLPGCSTGKGRDEMSILNEALAMKDILADYQRCIHQHAETESELPVTRSFVMEKLAEKVPAICVALAAGSPADGYRYSLHHPKVTFDENALPTLRRFMPTQHFAF